MNNLNKSMLALTGALHLTSISNQKSIVALALMLISSTAAAQAVLSLESVNGRADSVVAVPLNISNSPLSGGFNVEINLPDGLSVSNVSAGSFLGGAFSLHQQSDAMQNLRILGYSSSSTFSGSGALASLDLQIPAFAIPGFYTMGIATTNPDSGVNSRYALSNSDGSVSLPVGTANGNLFIYSFSSDFDGDQLPDNWEMANGLNHLLSTGEDGTNGDMDSDGISNLDEYRTGTDPGDGQDLPETANGVNYVYFRDHFDDDQYLDRWFEGTVTPNANYMIFEESIFDDSGILTDLSVKVIRPPGSGDCTELFLQSIATVDMANGVFVAKIHPYGFGRTSIGLSANGDLGTRVELLFDIDQAPYVTLRSFENGIETSYPGASQTTYLNDDIEVRIAKIGTNYTVYVNGVIQSAGIASNALLGSTSLQPFIAAESCFADTDFLSTYFDSVELLRDSDADGMADLHEDPNFNGVVDIGESDPSLQDTDGDNRLDGFDNCTLVVNTDQIDYDADGYGNRCDGDFDNNCSVNFLDYSNLTGNFLSTSHPQFDLTSDGVINFLDVSLFVPFFLQPPGPSGVISTCLTSP